MDTSLQIILYSYTVVHLFNGIRWFYATEMSEAPTVGRFVPKHCSGSRDARETKPLRHFLFLKRERKMGILEISRLFELSAPHVNQLIEDSEGVNWQRPGTRIHSNDQMRPYCKSTLNSFSLTIISSCTLAHFQLPFNLSAVITGWPTSLCVGGLKNIHSYRMLNLSDFTRWSHEEAEAVIRTQQVKSLNAAEFPDIVKLSSCHLLGRNAGNSLKSNYDEVIGGNNDQYRVKCAQIDHCYWLSLLQAAKCDSRTEQSLCFVSSTLKENIINESHERAKQSINVSTNRRCDLLPNVDSSAAGNSPQVFD